MPLPSRKLLLTAVAVATTAAAVAGVARLAQKARSGPGGQGSLEPIPAAPSFRITREGDPGELRIAAVTPQGPTQGRVRPTITFDRPVVPLATPEELRQLPAPATIRPEVAGEWRWLGSSTVEFVPEKLLPLATSFQVNIRGGLTATDGARLAADVTFAFETERPSVERLEPREKFRWATRRQPFSLTFSQPIDGLRDAVHLEANGQAVPLDVGPSVRVVEADLAEATNRWQRRSAEERRETDLRVRYLVTPKADLPVGAQLRLWLGDGIHGAAGPLELTGSRAWSFRVHGPMEIVAAATCTFETRAQPACPFGPVVLRTSNVADVKGLKGRLSVEPPVEIDWDEVSAQAPWAWDDDATPYLSIPGKFRPATRYKVRLAAGLPDEFGQAAAAWEGVVDTTDLTPIFELLTSRSRLQLVEAEGDGAIPLRSANVEALDLRFWRLTTESAAALLAAKAPGVPAEPPQLSTLRTGAARNAVKVQPLSVRTLLGGARTGLFLVDASAPAVDRGHPQRALGQLTDLAVHARLGVTSGAVWVTRVSTGAPVEGAEVALHGPSGAAAWRGTTGPDGVVRADALGAFAGVAQDSTWSDDQVRVVVSASKDGDTGLSVASWADGYHPGAFDVAADLSGGRPVELGLLMAERGIYRPGEMVHLKGFLRYRAMGELRTPPAGTQAALTVVNPRDATALTRTVTLGRFGTFDAEVALGAEVPLGTWRASAVAKVDGADLHLSGDFRVEAYRAPQFRVDVTAPAANLIAGEPVQASVLARYLFGAALADAPVRWNVIRKTFDFRPPGHDGWEFGVSAWDVDDGEPSESGDVAAAGTGRTDALGAFTVAAGRAQASAGRTWAYDVEAEVEDLDRRTVADRTGLLVHPAAVYAGVKRPAGFGEAGKPLDLQILAVTPSGMHRAAKVAVEVRRREWRSIRKKEAGGHYATITEPVEERVGGCATSPGEQPAACSVTPSKPGFHLIDATVEDDQGRKQVTRTTVYVIGGGWVAWQRDETDRIELVPDKAVYAVGDTARVLVKSPWPAAEALLTVEREGVRSARRVRLEGAATALEIPITEEAVPNVFVGLVAVRGRVAGQAPTPEDDPGRPAVKAGYVALKVETAGKRLAVEVKPAATTYRPRDTVKLDLSVRDAAGRGAVAEVTVWAVDEAVLRLTGYQRPDLLETFHPPRGLAVRAGEPLLGLVQRAVYSEKGGTAGGGGGGPEGAMLRSRFKTTPIFAPAVVTDAAGEAHVEFELPDNLTTFRIMAVAVTDHDLTGGGQASVTVNRPLMALPALPRAARVGDAFEAGVVIHAPGGKVPAVDVTAEVQGLRLDGPATQHVTIGDKAREVRFRLVAERPGQAVLRFTVRGGGEQDAVEQRLPVTLPVPLVATALHGETASAAKEQLVLPKDVRPDAGGLELTLSSTALGGFAEGFTQLVDYPYGCLEQLASRLVPFVSVKELAARGLAGPADWLLPPPTPGSAQLSGATPEEVMRKTVQAIEARQQPDGGYRYWEGSPCADPWSGAYAVWSLGRADQAGVPVDRAALRRGQAWLADTVLAGRPVSCNGWTVTPDLPARVFALFALARTGAPRASYHADFAARRAALPLFSKAMLADALARGGDKERAATVLLEVLNAAKITGAEVHLEEGDAARWLPWSSNGRSTAMALLATLSIRPEHPYVGRMVTWLARARRADGRFRNTQEAAYTLTALSDLVRLKEAEVPAFTGKISLAGQALATEPFRGRSLEVRRVRVPMADLQKGRTPGATLPLDVVRDGTAGALHYGALLTAAPVAPSAAAEDQGIFVQRWFEPWQGGGQVRTAQAGEVLRLRVRIGTPQQRSFVAVEIPMPSGFEAVDTTLESTARRPGPVTPGADGADAADRDRGWFWSPFHQVELRDDRVLLFADDLPPGLHTWSIAVRATTPGRFLLAPAHGEEMYAPEVYGRSDAGGFEIGAATVAGR